MTRGSDPIFRTLRSLAPGFLLGCIVLLLDLGCGRWYQPKDQPLAVKGVLDLSAWDSTREGPVALSGEYEFYWQQHLLPERFLQATQPKPSGVIQVPGVWNGYELGGEKLGGDGYATYRLQVRLKEPAPLALKLLDMATAYELYLNGIKLVAVGVAGETPENSVPRYFPQVVEFTPDTNRLEIIFHVTNFHHKKGGAWEVIFLGTEQDIRTARENALLLDVLLVGAIVIMGLYHLGLFTLRIKDRAPLYFGIFCLLIALRIATIEEIFFLRLFPHTGWELLVKLEYLGFYLAVPTFAMFLYALHREDVATRVIRAIQIISTIFCAIVLFTPARIFSHTIPAHQIYTIVCCSYGVYVITLSTIRKRQGAIINLVGFVILFITILNEILEYAGILHTPHILSFGLLVFVLSQGFLMSFRFSRAFRTIDRQRSDLEQANRQYEKELVERKHLEQRYRALYDDNPTMYFTVDAEGTVLSVNQFGLDYLGYAATDLIGQTVLKVFYEEDKPRVREQLATCVQDSDLVHEWELRKIRKDGTLLWVKEYARCVQNPSGQSLVLIVCQDVTLRRKAEEELYASRERLRDLGTHLQARVEQERAHIAKELHDELGQPLSSLNMELSLQEHKIKNADSERSVPALLRDIGLMRKLIVTTIAKVRSLITQLRPAILDTLGLIPALEWQLEEFHKRTGLTCEFLPEVNELRIPKEHELAVFRIFQESLSNIADHANASKVRVNVVKRNGVLWLEIFDDGKGISDEERNAPGKFGLLGMRERALVFDGEVSVTGMPGRGTSVKINVPLAVE